MCRRRQRLGERLLGCDQSVPFSRGFNRGYLGIMEKKMETTIVYYGIYIGFIGYIGIMENKMGPTI